MSYIVAVGDIRFEGDVTVTALPIREAGAEMGEVLVALAGDSFRGRVWIEVEPTGQTLIDLLWGPLPLYRVVN